MPTDKHLEEHIARLRVSLNSVIYNLKGLTLYAKDASNQLHELHEALELLHPEDPPEVNPLK